MKILVTDDSMLARVSLIKVAQQLEPNAEFIEAKDGQEAVDIYKKDASTIDLVFMDLTMPVMSGYDALIEIIKINPKAKVVVVTADVQPQAKQRVMESGAVTMIPKPISLEKLQELFIGGLI